MNSKISFHPDYGGGYVQNFADGIKVRLSGLIVQNICLFLRYNEIGTACLMGGCLPSTLHPSGESRKGGLLM